MPNAIVIDEYGGPDVMKLRPVTVGPPADHEARIAHTSIGINFHDVYVRSGLYRTLALPGTPGIEAAGVVTAVGRDVATLRVGDRVAYVTGKYGVYASERLIDASVLTKLPDGLSDSTAASALLRGLTVEMLVRRVYRVGRGTKVLAQAAAGGVGQMLCQWASHVGAEVIGTVGSDEQERLARAAGCRHTIRYQDADVAKAVMELTGGRGVDVAYDGVGKDSFAGSLDSLAPFGHLVNYGQASGPVPPFAVSALAARSTSLSRPIIFHYVEDARRRAEMTTNVFHALTEGWLRVQAPKDYPLAEAAAAHRDLEAHGASVPLLLIP